jgi:adenylate cyclase, class 1
VAKFFDRLKRRSSWSVELEPPPGERAAPEDRSPEHDARPSAPLDEDLTLLRNHHNFKAYNSSKIKFLYSQLPQRKKDVFDLIPLLIHVSGENLLTSSAACRQSIHGIFGYETSALTEESFGRVFPGKTMPKVSGVLTRNREMPINSLFLIGSLGSVAQNSKSDFDYWVCYEGREWTREALDAFQQKLKTIEVWAAGHAEAEVHFFPLDLRNVRVDDFGFARDESSGSAQGKLLKEEFYRSLTLIAGQTPLWWVLPPRVNDNEYERLRMLIQTSPRIDENDLVDMGNVHEVSWGDFYGAVIWQINKTIGSPFKSVLKMALLEDYMVNHGNKGLLCDELKERIIADQHQSELLDSYVLIFNRAGNYLADHGRMDDLNLLRQSFYLKSGVNLTPNDFRVRNLPRKKKVMVRLVREWGWDYDYIKKLNNFHFWSFNESQAFSQDINRFIFQTYKKVSTEIKKQKETVGLSINQRDLKVLSQKLAIFYSRRPNKVDSIKNVIEAPPVIGSLTLQPHPDENGQSVWQAYRGMLSREKIASGKSVSSLVRSSRYLAELLIWLVNNRLYDTNTSIILNSGIGDATPHCTVPDIQILLKELKEFFPQYKHSAISDTDLIKAPYPVRMYMIVNLEEPDKSVHVDRISTIYQNNWGEVFYHGYDSPAEGLDFALKFVSRRDEGDKRVPPPFFKVFLSDRHVKRVLIPRLNKLFRRVIA